MDALQRLRRESFHMRSRCCGFQLKPMRIRIQLFYLNADPDPIKGSKPMWIHADPDPIPGQTKSLIFT
jgi:hypothetical protein